MIQLVLSSLSRVSVRVRVADSPASSRPPSACCRASLPASTSSSSSPTTSAGDLFFGYNDQAVAHSYYPPHVWRNAEKVIINTRPIPFFLWPLMP